MKMKLPPHGLTRACDECGMTMAKLSENTGIPEQELVQFDAGELALSARDWLAILLVLLESAPHIEPRELRPGTVEAARKLYRDADYEDLVQQITGAEPEFPLQEAQGGSLPQAEGNKS
jgi:hypothetical protein